jgi:hypothetical protein
MQNITYNITENNNQSKEPVNIHTLVEDITNVCDNEQEDVEDFDILYAIQVDYSSNYCVKQLGQILDYYEIPKRKMRKDEMIQLIVLYENEPSNVEIVEKRKQLWKYVRELKKDKFFSKFLMIEL